MRPPFYVALALATAGSPACATISLTFAGFLNSLTGLSDEDSNTGIDGMFWGILVDTQNDGFPDLELALDQSGSLIDGLEVGPGDFFFPCGTTSSVNESFMESGPGSPQFASSIDTYSVPSISPGDAFAIVWFAPGVTEGDPLVPGLRYGILHVSGMNLPPDGNLGDFGSLFAGEDPVRNTTETVLIRMPLETTTSLVELDPGGGLPVTRNMAFTFPVSVAADDSGLLSYALEQSSSLEETSWMPVSSVPSILAEAGGIRTLQLVDPEPVGDVPRRFLRLRVSTP